MAALAGFGCQLAGIAFGTHMGQAHGAPAGYQKAAGPQHIANVLGHRLCFAGNQGFVRLSAAGAHNGVCTDLLAGGKLHNVIPHQLFAGQQNAFSVPQAAHLMRRHKGQLVHRVLAAQLLHRANDGIGNHNPQKGHVRKGPHQCQAKRQHDKNQIEKRKNIIPNDLGFAPGRRSRRMVIQPRRHALGCLFRGQALGWVCFQQRHLRAFGLWLGRGRLFACRARQL